jgi:hypothetical protein
MQQGPVDSSMNIAWWRDVDNLLGTHTECPVSLASWSDGRVQDRPLSTGTDWNVFQD